jgi:WhiB family redox-sensing transcriptional regulator
MLSLAVGAPPHFAHAACRGLDPSLFHPEAGEVSVVENAREVCNRCPEREPCLAYAIEHGEQLGVWGGLSALERRNLRRRRGGQIVAVSFDNIDEPDDAELAEVEHLVPPATSSPLAELVALAPSLPQGWKLEATASNITLSWSA